MVQCSILGCKNYTSKNKKDNITYHRFPKDPALRIRWIRATGRYNWQPTIHSRICSKHFGDQWFRQDKNGTFLNLGAYPKLFIQEPPDDDFCILEPATCNCNCHTEKNIGHKILISMGTQTNPLHEISDKNEESTQLAKTQDIPVKIDYNSPEQRLIRKLIKKTELAEDRFKKIALMRAKIWRLERKNTYLTSVIADLKSEIHSKKETSEELELLTSIQPINKVLLRNVEGVPVEHNFLRQCRVEVRKRVIYTLPRDEAESEGED